MTHCVKTQRHISVTIIILGTSSRPTLCSDEPSPRVCMSVQPEGKSCSNLDRVLVLTTLPHGRRGWFAERDTQSGHLPRAVGGRAWETMLQTSQGFYFFAVLGRCEEIPLL